MFHQHANHRACQLVTFGIVASVLLLASLLSGVHPVFAVPPARPQYAIVPISGQILTSTWTSDNIYVVTANASVPSTETLTIQGGTIIKLLPTVNLTIDGTLVLAGAADNRVIFTSYNDDTYGGDTNGNGGNTTPAAGDWGMITLTNSTTTFQYTTVRYGTKGVQVKNSSVDPISPSVVDNIFESNKNGVALDINSNANISSYIDHNVFTGNEYGLSTSQASAKTGTALPTLSSNAFTANTLLPIYLGGSAFPTFEGDTNTFTGYPSPEHPSPEQRLGIGLGGNFSYTGTLPIVHNANPDLRLPYVVVADMTVADGYTLNLALHTIVKFDSGKQLIIKGVLTSDATLQDPTVFTSFRDDTMAYGGDTNGDGSDFEPQPGDWKRIYFLNKDIIFQNALVRFAENGVYYDNQTHPAALSTFRPIIQNSVFDFDVNAVLFAAYDSATSRNEPTIANNTFTNLTGFPVVLVRTNFPIYTNNTFANNLHPAIQVVGKWYTSGTWTSVLGDGGTLMPYVAKEVVTNSLGSNVTVYPTITVVSGATLTLPPSTVVKLLDTNSTNPAQIIVDGDIDLQSTSTAPIVFTSYKDDSLDDTNGDGVASSPAKSNWKGIYLHNSATQIHDVVVKYSNFGVVVENKTANVLNPGIDHSVFDQNTFGVMLDIQGSGNITSAIASNTFTGNDYGLGTDATLNMRGISVPTLQENTFTGSTKFPIYLGGTADPIYLTNAFSSNVHRAIALGGYFGNNATLTRVPGDSDAPVSNMVFPYVIINDMTMDTNYSLTLPAATIIKFDASKRLDVKGGLILQSTPTQRITFTSYKDDFYDDTNADPAAPARSNWKGVYLYSNLTENIEYSNFKYADEGVVVYQSGSVDLAPRISRDQFSENNKAITLYIKSNFSITSEITENDIFSNNYGLYTVSDTSTSTRYAGCVNPLLSTNIFTGHANFPIYLNGSSDPTYLNNTFGNNTHPAIALGGYWACDATWTTVPGDNTLPFPYVVLNFVTQDDFSTITIPANTVIKFDKTSAGTGIYAWGTLNMLSTPVSTIKFTSYLDDTIAGDTNADGNATTPSRTDWKTVWLIDSPMKTNHFHDAVVRYAVAGVGVYYDGLANTAVSTDIRDSLLEYNHSGVMLAIGWHADNPTSLDRFGKGDIAATITDVMFNNNNNGLITFAQPKSSGISRPVLSGVNFNNTASFPVYLGGTAFPSFLDSSITGSPTWIGAGGDGLSTQGIGETPVEVSVEGENLPGVIARRNQPVAQHAPQAAALAPASDLSVNSLAPGIALAGAFNNTGDMVYVPGLPYLVVGNYPVSLTVDGVTTTVDSDLTIGTVNASGSRVTFQGGSILKFGSGRKMTVNGGLNLHLSSASSPVIFTSYKDDTAGGDSNLDGNHTTPVKGDWVGVKLTSSDTVFNYAIMRYATEGLHIYFAGSLNQNISPEVSNSTFTNNTTAITLWAAGDGDIVDPVDPSDNTKTIPAVHDNLFFNNTTHILGHINKNSSGTVVNGRLLLTITRNDLLPATTFGINNLSTNRTLNALGNYWGDPTGPYNLILNPTGMGVPVSDRVNFDPYLAGPVHQAMLYKISGHITQLGSIPQAGLAGVNVTLLPEGTKTVTGQDGYYAFDGLPVGQYTVVPDLAGWIFAPSLSKVDLIADSTADFEGTLGVSDTYVVVNNISVLQLVAGTVNAVFTISLTKASSVPVYVDYITQDGTAIAPDDYTALTKKSITFNAGETSKTVTVVVKAGPTTEAAEFFSVILSNPRPTLNVKLLPNGDTGICTIVPASSLIFLPTIRK